MRDPKRIPDILHVLGTLWTQPGTDQLRLGQLISNAAFSGGWKHDDLFYCEDDTMMKGLREMARKKDAEIRGENEKSSNTR